MPHAVTLTAFQPYRSVSLRIIRQGVVKEEERTAQTALGVTQRPCGAQGKILKPLLTCFNVKKLRNFKVY